MSTQYLQTGNAMRVSVQSADLKALGITDSKVAVDLRARQMQIPEATAFALRRTVTICEWPWADSRCRHFKG